MKKLELASEQKNYTDDDIDKVIEDTCEKVISEYEKKKKEKEGRIDPTKKKGTFLLNLHN